ncbi:MAG: hypothetical protein NW220_16465 [Leptolyngbyaceae cyanobacterium bins.349]|nr:hypothetical protein [Leptolyngbyaceae cyanobacterium bins.349]
MIQACKPLQQTMTLVFLGAIALVPPVAIAQESNFGQLALNPNNPSGRLRGTTGGTASLPAIVSNRDRHDQQCLGFADPKPDHLLILEKPFTTLTLQVRSTTDTTLVVQGPDGIVRCGDDAGTDKNATIQDIDWSAGKYKVWVGTATPGMQRDYTLTVQP